MQDAMWSAPLLALLNDDIIRIVFQHLIPPVPPAAPAGKQARFEDPSVQLRVFWRTCYSLSLVCKAFADPALDLLWEDLYDIRKLLRLLSSFGQNSKGLFDITGDISTHEWERLQIYARRIRKLQVMEGRSLIALSLYASLLNACSGDPFLPQLRELRWACSSYIHNGILLVISPKLTDLVISQRNWPGGIKPGRSTAEEEFVLKTLSATSLELSSLTITSVPITALAIRYLPNFRQLQCLRLMHKSTQHPIFDVNDQWSILLAISAQVNLEELEIAIQNTKKHTPKLSFPSLRILTVYGTCTAIHAFISQVSSPRLFSFTFGRVRNPEQGWDLWQCIDTVSSHFRHSLQLLRLQTRSVIINGDSFIHGIMPLLKLPQLRELSMDLKFNGQISLTDEDVYAMAMAWPEIRILRLRDFSNPEAAPSIACLRSFAKYCHRLRRLHLPVDFSIPVDLINHDSELECQWALRCIAFSLPYNASTPENPEDFANYIFHIFPGIKVEMSRRWSKDVTLFHVEPILEIIEDLQHRWSDVIQSNDDWNSDICSPVTRDDSVDML